MSERRRRAEEVRGLADWFRNSGHPTEEAILRAAADLLDPPARKRVVRARIAVAVTRGGEFFAIGGSGVPNDWSSRVAANNAGSDKDSMAPPPQIRFAVVMVPAWAPPPTIEGEVVS